VDIDPEAVSLAAGRARRPGVSGAAFVAGDALHLPLAPAFDVAILVETMLAIEDKHAVLSELRRLLKPGGRLAITLEAGEPLSPSERRRLPDGDRVWFFPEGRYRQLMAEFGFRVTWSRDLTAGHAARTRHLARAYARQRAAIVAGMGEAFWPAIVAQHRTFAAGLEQGRLRTVAVVARRDV
jgi:ubiquinone/menaquinone biosynthesis C-methylase UbiE